MLRKAVYSELGAAAPGSDIPPAPPLWASLAVPVRHRLRIRSLRDSSRAAGRVAGPSHWSGLRRRA